MRILIADDHELFLKGLEFILRDIFPTDEFVFAHSYTDIFKIIEDTPADFKLVLTDLAMPGANWLKGIEQIHSKLPETPIIILSAVFEKEIVQKTIEIGAAGYIPKTSPNAVITSAVNLVLSGGVYIPPELLGNVKESEFDLLKQFENSEDTEKLPHNANGTIFSPRQTEVLSLMAKGYSNKQIAYELGITEGTVKLYVTAILKNLDVYNRTSAVNEARKRGLVKDER